jgi:hypothetical protein
MKRTRVHGSYEATSHLDLYELARECVLHAWALGLRQDISVSESSEIVARMLGDLEAEAKGKRMKRNR